MNKFALVLITLCTAVAPAFAGLPAKVLSVSGVVRVAPSGSEVYSQATVGQPLSEGMRVTTGDNGRVAIEVGPNNTVRLRSNAKIVIGASRPRVTRFQLVSG